MQTFSSLIQSSEISNLFKGATTIAIVGLSPKENRPSNMVGRYLVAAGYTVYPINPGQNEVLGKKCYPALVALPFSVDIVNIFRKSEEVMTIVEEALALHTLPKAIWMQQGIINEEAAQLARNMGVFVVMDRCIKVDHSNLIRR
ncbi:MAG: CoA-binding protein [Proteobacteria bacterium]|nr:CoA-binding protein [Pseudomonadota bacterium]